MALVSIVVKESHKGPEVREIDPTLENLQAIIGGYLEAIPYNEGLTLAFDEDGHRKANLAPNIMFASVGVIVGPVIVFKSDRKGDIISLDERGIAVALNSLDYFAV